jgi:hypothetical protein
LNWNVLGENFNNKLAPIIKYIHQDLKSSALMQRAHGQPARNIVSAKWCLTLASWQQSTLHEDSGW